MRDKKLKLKELKASHTETKAKIEIPTVLAFCLCVWDFYSLTPSDEWPDEPPE